MLFSTFAIIFTVNIVLTLKVIFTLEYMCVVIAGWGYYCFSEKFKNMREKCIKVVTENVNS